MISVIVCSRQGPEWTRHQKHVADTIGCDHEYVRIDNRGNQYGICAAYNEGVRKASGDILVFVHEDVFFLGNGWGETLQQKFGTDTTIGMVGIAGGQFLHQDAPGWCAGGRPYIHGKVIHQLNGRLLLTVYSWIQQDVDVAVVDGLFFAIRASLFERVRFDEDSFDGFHFYDLDICMQVRESHRILVTEDILVKHLSGGAFDKKWETYAARFVEKHQNKLPINCGQREPGPDKEKFETFDITQRLPAILDV